MVDIVLVTWGRPLLTKATIDSIRQNTKRRNYRLIVVDNNSDEHTVGMLRDYRDVGDIDVLIENDTNRGLEPARNQGLAEVTSLYFVCLDNDLLCPPPKDGKDWIERMGELFHEHPEYGAIAMRTQVMIGTGNIFDGHEDDDIVDFPHPGGSYRMMHTESVKAIGGWREEVGSRGQEERYICGELHKLGAKTGFAVKIKSLHLHGDQTTDGWGYPKGWKPEDSGHSDVWHPILLNGDDFLQVQHFLKTGEYE